MAQVFISYSTKDAEFARHLRSLLHAEDFSVWMDEIGITPGERWWRTIEQNLIGCAALIVIMSPHSQDSDWVERELLLAEAENKRIYPVLLSGKPWTRLANIQYEDMRDGLRTKLTASFIQSLKTTVSGRTKRDDIILQIVHGDITTINADVIALKYAQYFFGADRQVATLLNEIGVPLEQLSPPAGSHKLIQTQGQVRARQALFLGVSTARDFNYTDIQEMSARALKVTQDSPLPVEHLAMTMHGAGFGLDETAALIAQCYGYLEALESSQFPTSLKTVSIVERNRERVVRLRHTFEENFKDSFQPVTSSETDWAYKFSGTFATQRNPTESKRRVEASETAPYTFVLISNDPSTDDLFYYGIQGAVHASEMLCVRMSFEAHGTDTVQQILQKIDSATLVIVDLARVNAHLYLYLGYAWGKECPTILIKNAQTQTELDDSELTFVDYERIRDLEVRLTDKIKSMKLSGFVS